MGIFNRKKQAVVEEAPKQVEERSYAWPSSVFYGLFSHGKGEAMNLSAFYRGVDTISNSIGVMPLYIEKVDSLTGYKMKIEHPLSKVLWRSPDKRFSRFNFFKSLVECMILEGNGFGLIKRDSRYNVIGIDLLNPAFVQVMFNDAGEIVYIVDGLKKAVPASDMIHIFRRCDEMHRGISVLKYARESLESAKSGEEQAKNFFKTGGNLSGIITSSANFNDAQKNQIINSFASTIGNGGPGVALLPPNFTYTQIGVDPTDGQLLESRKFSIEDIARWLGIPLSKLQVYGQESYNSLEYAQLNYLFDTIYPIARIILDEFNVKLFKPSEIGVNEINFQYDALVEADKSTQAKYFRELLVNGILTVNEIRVALGYAPYDGPCGDTHWIQISMADADKVSEGAYIKQNSQDQNQDTNNQVTGAQE